ncbi:hypothetical protein [Streptomyces sp. NPDC001999]
MGSIQSDVNWPFEGNTFPDGLLAIVQRTVSDGHFPALAVIHDDEDDWLVSDDIHDPNEDGASVILHLDHVLQLDPSLRQLATLAPGHVATRTDAHAPWKITAWSYSEG